MAGQDAAQEAGNYSVFVQSVPRWHSATQHNALAAAAPGSIPAPATDDAALVADVHVELLAPVIVTSGSLAWWAPN